MEAAMYAARAACLAGCRATSNVDAGYRFGVPVSGTMAHSWVMAHPDELTAFSRYVAVYGPRSVLLIDTYDSIAAARLIVRAGLRPAAVRLDSGDLVHLSRVVRDVLDAGGLADTQILVTGDLDEHKVAALVSAGAPIDGFGVGTALSTSSDAPSLSGVYKLVEIDRAGTLTPVMKLSAGKRTYPGAKQLWRVYGPGGPVRDVVGLAGEAAPRDGGAAPDVCREGWRAAAADARDPPDPGCLPDRRGASPGGGAATSGRCGVSSGPERRPRAVGCHRSREAVYVRHGMLDRSLGDIVRSESLVPR
jgi:nicotinate phosphoribosyltransferase